jgi:cyclopropane-fatty-acyl-phospholipid synthase
MAGFWSGIWGIIASLDEAMFIHYLQQHIRHGSIKLSLPDGTVTTVGRGAPEAHWIINDASAIGRILRDPDLELGETYMDGLWATNPGGLLPLLKILMRNFSESKEKGFRRLGAALRKLLAIGNRISRSYKNVSHHYDLDEWLFRRFLDTGMFYSCAYFEQPGMTLEQAQLAKCELIARKLMLRPGLKVLDIGSGWGGLAFYLAERSGVQVTGITLSREQLRVARNEARNRKLDHLVRFELQDYREHVGQYDRIASIGMFEHVGARHYDQFFNIVNRLLVGDGIAVIHTIGESSHSHSTNAWIRRHIFPGGYIPALSEMSRAVEQGPMITTDVEILRLHYADTLAEWLHRFSSHRDEVADRMGQRFCRMWEFYLASTSAAFRWWDLVVFHVQLAKRHGVVPNTRDYLIADRSRETVPSGSKRVTE